MHLQGRSPCIRPFTSYTLQACLFTVAHLCLLLQQEAAAAAALAAEMDAMSKRASFILGPLQPPPVGLTPEVVAEARQLLAEKAEADADALWEQEKGRAVEAAREAAEAQAAEDRAQYDAAVAEAQEVRLGLMGVLRGK